MRPARIVAAACLTGGMIAAVACASGSSASMRGRNPDLITRTEIVQSGATNALEAIERLRPLFLRPRGGVSIREGAQPHPPQVFVDGLELGGPEVLRDIPASSIVEIRYAPNRDDQSRLGSGQYGGVIHIRTGRSG